MCGTTFVIIIGQLPVLAALTDPIKIQAISRVTAITENITSRFYRGTDEPPHSTGDALQDHLGESCELVW